MTTVHCEGLTYSYPQPSAEDSPFADNPPPETAEVCTQLTDVNLTLPAGTLTLLVGASGSGKSTLLRTMNGLIPHFHEGELSGLVEVGSQDVTAQPLHDAGRLSAMIFQNPRTQFFTPYVDTELAFGLENYGTPREEICRRVMAAAAQTGVTHLLARRLDTLSGGELQRVACASALVADVDLLLFDEPTSNLSGSAIDEFAGLVASLKSLGKTLVIAEHRLHLFRHTADLVVRISDGQVAATMTGEEFFAQSEDARIAAGLRSLHPTRAPRPTPPTDAAGLHLSDIRFAYRRGPQVLDIGQMAFPAGAVTALCGENGVGKTTLARVLCGLEKPAPGGQITLDGTPLTARQRSRRCGIVMQDVRRQLFSASVAEEVSLGTQNVSEDTVDALLERLELAEFKPRHPLSLSGGQAQRLVVAACVAADKDVMIFDEPTSGVDWRHLSSIAALLRDLAALGRVVIVITHDEELIAQCADYRVTLPPRKD